MRVSGLRMHTCGIAMRAILLFESVLSDFGSIAVQNSVHER